MNNITKTKIATVALISSALLLQTPNSFAAKIFVSNNKGTVSFNQAYKRLYGRAQTKLIDDTTHILQKGHYQEGRMHQLLGAYYMQNTKQLTGDNTLEFITSPYESVKKGKVLKTANTLAKQYKQESVAIFIQNKNGQSADTVATFREHQPIYAQIKQKIKTLQSSGVVALSIEFQRGAHDLEHAKIAKIEWLTSKEKETVLKHAFASAELTTQYGDASLVFQNGQEQKIN